MVTKKQLIDGVLKFVESEIIPAIGGWEGGMAYIGVGILRRKADWVASYIDQYLNHPVAKALGIVTDDGRIDIDTAYEAFKEHASKILPRTVEIPLLNPITFHESTIDVLYAYIKDKSNTQPIQQPSAQYKRPEPIIPGQTMRPEPRPVDNVSAEGN